MLPHYLVKHLNIRKQESSGKLQRSVPTSLRCSGVISNQIKKGLLLSLSVIFLNWWIFRKVTSKNVDVSYTVCASGHQTAKRRIKCTRQPWSGGIVSCHFTANLPGNLLVKSICKSNKIWQNYGHEFVASLFWPTLYMCLFVCTGAHSVTTHVTYGSVVLRRRWDTL